MNMTDGVKLVVLSTEYKNISNTSFIYIYNKFKQYRWYEIITYNSKQIQILIGVQKSLVLPTQASNYHLL